MPVLRCSNAASRTARRTTGIPRSSATFSSGFSFVIADEYTTRFGSAAAMRSASWPIWISAPRFLSSSTASFATRSDPPIQQPKSSKRCAIALMPQPPAPTRYTRALGPSRFKSSSVCSQVSEFIRLQAGKPAIQQTESQRHEVYRSGSRVFGLRLPLLHLAPAIVGRYS